MKKLLVIAPILCQSSEIHNILASLDFLEGDYKIDIKDPLENLVAGSTRAAFFSEWHDKLSRLVDNYDGFLAFSFGGVILQHCLKLFEEKNKPIILFSTPSFSDEQLTEKLSTIIALIRERAVTSAVKKLNEYVYYPYGAPSPEVQIDNSEHTAFRLTHGFQLLLEVDSRAILKETKVSHMHLIGKESCLVNRSNIVIPSACHLIAVPDAGMRVLQNNKSYCVNPITKFLEGKIK